MQEGPFMQWTDIKITVPKLQADDAEAIATGNLAARAI